MSENLTVDAAGPEMLTFEKLVRTIADGIGRPRRIVRVPPWLALTLLRTVGLALGEVVLSRQERDGLMQELLVSREPPRAATSVTRWLREHGSGLGRRYGSEVTRHFRPA